MPEKCECTGAEAVECHALCPMAGHQRGLCIHCEDENDE